MEMLFGKYPFALSEGAFPVTTDSVLLAWFAAREGRFLDLGCGCGLLGVLLAIRSGARVDGVEIDPGAARAARENYASCGQPGRVFEGDARVFKTGEKYDHCVFNPPYYRGKSGRLFRARTAGSGGISEFVAAAKRLCPEGRLFFCFPPGGRFEAESALKKQGYLSYGLLPVRHSADKPEFVFLAETRTDGMGIRIYSPLILTQGGEFTPQYQRIYGDEKWTWENFTS